MSYTNSTEHYNLPQYIGADKPTYLGDMNSAYRKIDSALYEANTNANAASEGLAETTQTATNANTQAQENKSNIASIRANVLQLSQNLENSKIKLTTATFLPLVINNFNGADVVFNSPNPQARFFEIDLGSNIGKLYYLSCNFSAKSTKESAIVDVVRSITIPGLNRYWNQSTTDTTDVGYVSVQGKYNDNVVRDYMPSLAAVTGIGGRSEYSLTLFGQSRITVTPNVNMQFAIHATLFNPTTPL